MYKSSVVIVILRLYSYSIISFKVRVFLTQTQFFRSHGLATEDARQKYSSRVAQLYRDKLSAMSEQAMKTYGTKVRTVLTYKYNISETSNNIAKLF